MKTREINDFFLKSREWRIVRMRALEKHGARCQACGRTAADGVVINVDHVKDRGRYPELALDIDNLQVLCAPCNHGKGTGGHDWRPTAPSAPASDWATLLDTMSCALLIAPNLGRLIDVPHPVDGGIHAAALCALVDYCQRDGAAHTTASVMQHFAPPHRLAGQFFVLLSLAQNNPPWGEADAKMALFECVKRYWAARVARHA